VLGAGMRVAVLLLVSCCCLSVVAGCTPNVDVLGAPTDSSAARLLTCLDMSLDGTCNKKMCRASYGAVGSSNDCGSYAAACTSAGLKWEGNSQEGVCSKP
jgi:hypothetical protein